MKLNACYNQPNAEWCWWIFKPGWHSGSSQPRDKCWSTTLSLSLAQPSCSVSTSASRVYSGPLLPSLHEVLSSVKPIERRNMNLWEDAIAREAVLAMNRKRLIVAGLLTESCVSLLALSALNEHFEVFVVGDACGGSSTVGHDLALRRMEAAGAQVTSWLQVLLEFQRDWTRHDTYDGARAIVETNGGGYGIGLAYARDMIHPG
jgi:hypothetical protein